MTLKRTPPIDKNKNEKESDKERNITTRSRQRDRSHETQSFPSTSRNTNITTIKFIENSSTIYPIIGKYN